MFCVMQKMQTLWNMKVLAFIFDAFFFISGEAALRQ